MASWNTSAEDVAAEEMTQASEARMQCTLLHVGTAGVAPLPRPIQHALRNLFLQMAALTQLDIHINKTLKSKYSNSPSVASFCNFCTLYSKRS